MADIRFRIKFKTQDGEQAFELSEAEARELHRALDGVVGEKRGTTYIPMPYPVPHVPTWQPIWFTTTAPQFVPETVVTCYSLEMLV